MHHAQPVERLPQGSLLLYLYFPPSHFSLSLIRSQPQWILVPCCLTCRARTLSQCGLRAAAAERCNNVELSGARSCVPIQQCSSMGLHGCSVLTSLKPGLRVRRRRKSWVASRTSMWKCLQEGNRSYEYRERTCRNRGERRGHGGIRSVYGCYAKLHEWACGPILQRLAVKISARPNVRNEQVPPSATGHENDGIGRILALDNHHNLATGVRQ